MQMSTWADMDRLSQYLYPASRPAYTRRERLLGRALDGRAGDEVLRQRLIVSEVVEELLGLGAIPLHGRPDGRAQSQVRDRDRRGHRVAQRERDRDQLGQAGALVDRDRGRRAVGRGDDRERVGQRARRRHLAQDALDQDPLVLLALNVALGKRAGPHEAERLVAVERLAALLEVQAGLRV